MIWLYLPTTLSLYFINVTAAPLSILHSVAWFADAINCAEVDEINWQS